MKPQSANTPRTKRIPRIIRWTAWLGLVVILLLEVYFLHKTPKFQLAGELISHVESPDSLLALTFDDGPGNIETTREVLDILDEYEVKATFFLVGEAMARQTEAVQEIVARGHELANHSYTHQMMLLKSQSWLAQEIEDTDKLIRDTGHEGEIYFRPPYGKKLLTLPIYLARNDRTTITWDVDADSKSMETETIRQNVKEGIKPGSIILMHVLLSSRKGSREALPGILADAQQSGYEFVRLSELLK